VGFVFRHVKLCCQAGGIAMPDSVTARVFPDETKCFFPVEILLAPDYGSFLRTGLPAPLARLTPNSTATR
jgi:hypothetical protein